MIEGGFGNSINQIMGWPGPITHRQVTAYIEWRTLSLNYPSRDNYYQMMEACTVARSNAKTPSAVQPSQFRLHFGKDEPITREERDRRAKEVMEARIAARGGLERYIIMDAQGNVIREAEQSSAVSKHPYVRGPTAEEFMEFRERQRVEKLGPVFVDSQSFVRYGVRNPRRSSDSNGPAPTGVTNAIDNGTGETRHLSNGGCVPPDTTTDDGGKGT